MPWRDRHGSNFISFGSSSIIKSLLRDFDFISTRGSKFAFFDRCPLTSFRSHMLKIRSCSAPKPPLIERPTETTSRISSVLRTSCFHQVLHWRRGATIGVGSDGVCHHFSTMHRCTNDGRIWFSRYMTSSVYSRYHLLRDKLNIGRIGWTSRGPDRLGPIGEAGYVNRYADRCVGRPDQCRNREAIGKIWAARNIFGS